MDKKICPECNGEKQTYLVHTVIWDDVTKAIKEETQTTGCPRCNGTGEVEEDEWEDES